MSERFETSDIPARAVARAGAWLAFSVLIVFLFIYTMLHLLRSHAPAAAQVTLQPPAPRLQVNPPADLATLRDWEEARLSTYRWIDRDQKIIGIPITRAMDLTVERGLPARPTP